MCFQGSRLHKKKRKSEVNDTTWHQTIALTLSITCFLTFNLDPRVHNIDTLFKAFQIPGSFFFVRRGFIAETCVATLRSVTEKVPASTALADVALRHLAAVVARMEKNAQRKPTTRCLTTRNLQRSVCDHTLDHVHRFSGENTKQRGVFQPQGRRKNSNAGEL